ncbi:grl-4, partial [Pristionchus pacificus]|uniref:Grl-4 n=1 Tax=Pristionchus pacificus TaxID=54126 RepID=A0A2A6CB36_PRIPA
INRDIHQMSYILLLSLLPIASANFFGSPCGCGGYIAPPPPPCPLRLPQICPPLPPPCPPPPLCLPTICPPPLPCPPPPPPPPPPMCPMPLPPPPSPCTSYAQVPMFPPPAPISLPSLPSYATPFNDCCCRCGRPCSFRAMARMHGSKTFKTSDVEEDPQCNHRKLKEIMEDNLTSDPSIAKRAIQKAAEEKLEGKFNVICAKGDFTYVAYTEKYCQASNDDVTCYAFSPM